MRVHTTHTHTRVRARTCEPSSVERSAACPPHGVFGCGPRRPAASVAAFVPSRGWVTKGHLADLQGAGSLGRLRQPQLLVEPAPREDWEMPAPSWRTPSEDPVQVTRTRFLWRRAREGTCPRGPECPHGAGHRASRQVSRRQVHRGTLWRRFCPFIFNPSRKSEAAPEGFG